MKLKPNQYKVEFNKVTMLVEFDPNWQGNPQEFIDKHKKENPYEMMADLCHHPVEFIGMICK